MIIAIESMILCLVFTMMVCALAGLMVQFIL